MKRRPTNAEVTEANELYSKAVEVLALETAYDFHDIIKDEELTVKTQKDFCRHFFNGIAIEDLPHESLRTLQLYQEVFGKLD